MGPRIAISPRTEFSKRWLGRKPYDESRERVPCLSRRAAGFPDWLNLGEHRRLFIVSPQPTPRKLRCYRPARALGSCRYFAAWGFSPSRRLLLGASALTYEASPRRNDCYLEPVLRQVRFCSELAASTRGNGFAVGLFSSRRKQLSLVHRGPTTCASQASNH